MPKPSSRTCPASTRWPTATARLVPAALGIFGHGNVAGLGQALDQHSDALPFIQGRNEQALVHGDGFARRPGARATAVTASIGPGAMNMVTGAALATVTGFRCSCCRRATPTRQGPVLQQLQHPVEADASVNDAFRPVSRFFDRISRPEALLTALPAAMRVLTDPAQTGAAVLSLPQDVQSHAYDWPAELFDERDWVIRRPVPDPDEIDAVVRMLRAVRPLIIAGGGVIYSGATRELEALAAATGDPGGRDVRRQGRGAATAWWQLGGIGLEGTPATNDLAREADLVLTVGSRLTDFATASQSLFQNPDVRFASINVDVHDAGRLGATGIVADAKQALAALTRAVQDARITSPAAWERRCVSATISGRRNGSRAGPGHALRQVDGRHRLRRGDQHRRGADPGPDHRSAAGAARHGDTIIARRWPTRRPAEGLGRHRRPLLPPGVRLLLHGLRDPSRTGRATGVPRPNQARGVVYRGRHVPDGAHRAGHRRAGCRSPSSSPRTTATR